MVGSEAGIDIEDMQEAPDEQAGAADEDDGQGELRDHEAAVRGPQTASARKTLPQ